MSETKKMTIPKSSVGADEEQPFVNNNKNIISQNSPFDNVEELHIMNMDELFDTTFPPKVQIVDNLLCEGVYLFVGSPKVGKSFFMAQLGYSISKGVDLWRYKVHTGTVLYLALEDGFSRLQKRLSTMYGTDSTDKFHFATRSKNLNEGLNMQLKNFIKAHSDTKLIIIDTLQKIREKGGEQYNYASDYDIVTHLKDFAEVHNICVLVVHHTRKQASDDSFDSISGTNGLFGAADGAFIMQKPKRISGKATLDVVGRDNADQRLHLEFNKTKCVWELTNVETEISDEPKNPLLEKVGAFITENNPVWVGSATELITELSDDTLSPNSITRQLNVNADKLLNDYGIKIDSKRTHSGRQIQLSKI